MKYLLIILLLLSVSIFSCSKENMKNEGKVNNTLTDSTAGGPTAGNYNQKDTSKVKIIIPSNDVSILNLKIQYLEKDFTELKTDVRREFEILKEKHNDLKWFIQVFVALLSLGLTLFSISVSFVIFYLNKQSKASIKSLKEDTEKELSSAKEEIFNKVNEIESLHEQAKANVNETLKFKNQSEEVAKELSDTLSKAKETSPELKAKIKSTVNNLEKQPENELSYFDWYLKGYQLHQNKDYYGAIYHFTKSIEASPEFPDAYTMRGVSYLRVKKYIESNSNFNKSVKLNPNIRFNILNLSESFIFIKQYSDSLKQLAKLDDLTLVIEDIVTKYFLKLIAEILSNINTTNSEKVFEKNLILLKESKQLITWNLNDLEEWLKDNPDIPEDKLKFIQDLIDKLKKLK